MLEPVPPLSRFLRACNLGGAVDRQKKKKKKKFDQEEFVHNIIEK